MNITLTLVKTPTFGGFLKWRVSTNNHGFSYKKPIILGCEMGGTTILGNPNISAQTFSCCLW